MFSSFYVKLLTDKHTDRQYDKQTNKRRVLHNVLGGYNYNVGPTRRTCTFYCDVEYKAQQIKYGRHYRISRLV